MILMLIHAYFCTPRSLHTSHLAPSDAQLDKQNLLHDGPCKLGRNLVLRAAVARGRTYRKCLGHGDPSPTDEISIPTQGLKEWVQTLFVFCPLRTQHSRHHLSSRDQCFSRHWTCQHLDLPFFVHYSVCGVLLQLHKWTRTPVKLQVLDWGNFSRRVSFYVPLSSDLVTLEFNLWVSGTSTLFDPYHLEGISPRYTWTDVSNSHQAAGENKGKMQEKRREELLVTSNSYINLPPACNWGCTVCALAH
jgi:hypothetical protein